VAEVQRWYAPLLDTKTHRTIVADVRAQIADLFGLRLAHLVVISPGSLPKTSSGKLRRRHCRELFMSDKLDRAEIQEPIESVGGGNTEAA
jgi:acyl-CoA synthetase (AMP-forming)/AMP-acid ligase II